MSCHKLPENRQEYEVWMQKLSQQTQEAETGKEITCICELSFLVIYMYKCYYCGLWLCATCAKKHFGERPQGKYTYKNYFKGE